MAARNEDALLFIAEWFDPMPQLKKKYLLKYYADQHMVEMIDIKSKKAFLKKSPCPPEILASEFMIGGRVLLYSRELDLVDYGDLKTKEKLSNQLQTVVLILPADIYSNWGNIITSLVNTNPSSMNLLSLRTCLLTENMSINIHQMLEMQNSPKTLINLLSGTNLAIAVTGEDGFTTVELTLSGSFSNVLYSRTGLQSSDLMDLLFNNNNKSSLDSSTLDNCTCCIIKPHILKTKQFGYIINDIIKQGYEISAMKSLYFDKISSEEFLEVYKGVLPDFGDHAIQLASGLAIALEIRAQNAVSTFRMSAGPWDVEMAKELRPNTIRGQYGVDRVRNALHCTDLDTDGAMECEYCFRLI
eukprot:gene14602-19609_t